MDIPSNAREDAERILANLLPPKSSGKYVQTYDLFMKWNADQEINQDNFSEIVILVTSVTSKVKIL